MHSPKKSWTPPLIERFADGERVWTHYESRGTPEERARLRKMLDMLGPDAREVESRPVKRRA